MGGREDLTGGHRGDIRVWKACFHMAVETGAVAHGWKLFPSEKQAASLSYVFGYNLHRLQNDSTGGFGSQSLVAGGRSSGSFQKGGSAGSFDPQETETLTVTTDWGQGHRWHLAHRGPDASSTRPAMHGTAARDSRTGQPRSTESAIRPQTLIVPSLGNLLKKEFLH